MHARSRLLAILLALAIGAGAHALGYTHAPTAYKDPTGDDRSRPALALKAPPLRHGSENREQIALKAPPLRHEA